MLMVGAGGIGCELVKTLVLSGFRKITMVRLAATLPTCHTGAAAY